jgi:hypothetical protein
MAAAPLPASLEKDEGRPSRQRRNGAGDDRGGRDKDLSMPEDLGEEHLLQLRRLGRDRGRRGRDCPHRPTAEFS